MTKLFTLIVCFLTAFALNAQILLEENFDGGAPAGWTQLTGATDGGWKFGTSAALSSSSFPIPSNGTGIAATNDDGCNCDKNADYFVTPSIDMSAVAAATLKFDLFYYDATYQGVPEHAFIDVSTDGGATWTNVATLPGSDVWQTSYLVDLTSYVGNSDVKVAFHYTDGGGWLYGWAIDNVSIFAPADHDISVIGLDIPRFAPFGGDVTIKGQIRNFGGNNLTSFDLSWSDGVNTYTDQITGIDIPYLGTYDFTHSAPFPLPQAVTYSCSVWADNPNNNPDANPGDNQQDALVSGVTYIPTKKMAAEEATGTWCGWCPRGTDWMDFMTQNYEDSFVGIAVHNGDPMTVTAYDNGVGNFPGFSGYPSVIVDRYEIVDPSDLENVLPDYLERIAPVAPSITAQLDVESRMFTSSATTEFVTELDNLDYRMNIVLTEDGVHGTSSGYAQTNYYSFQSQNLPDPVSGVGLDWQQEPTPVPASDMWYNHVGRILSNGWAGEAGSIPASVTAGDMATKDYSIPNFDAKGWNPFNMHAVVLVTDNATGEILNAESTPVDVICPTDLGVTFDVTDATTNGTTDGAVTVTEPGTTPGFPPYSYEWSNGETTPDLTDISYGDYTVVVSDKIGCTQTYDVTVNATTGVSEIETLTGISLTPNPASTLSVLNVQFSKAVDMRLEVVNAAGQVMYATAVNNTLGGQYNLDLASYADGIYFVKVSVGEQANVKRLMVSK